MGIYGYMWTYIVIIIYIYIYICPSGGRSLVCPFQRVCSTSPPDAGVSGSNTPIVDYFVGTGLMGMFLWTVGSFYVLGEWWDLTWHLPRRLSFV